MKFNKKLWALLPFLALASCTEDIDTSSRYVFKEPTIMSYLDGQPKYSQYCDLLGKVRVSKMSETTIRQLISERGNYT